jgi:hypothetical protein
VEIFQDLRKRGLPTGENDLWIAATALVAGRPLVTSNIKDFSKIHGLQVLSRKILGHGFSHAAEWRRGGFGKTTGTAGDLDG